MIPQIRERVGRIPRNRGSSTFGQTGSGTGSGGGDPYGYSVSFQAFLQTSIVPENASGSPTPTYTRASTAYQEDFEAKLNLVPSGAVRMQGARYVRNLAVTTSEDITNGAWTKNGVTATTATLQTSGNDGGATYHYVSQSYTHVAGHTYNITVKAKQGTKSILWLLGDPNGNGFAYFNLATGTVGTVGAGITSAISTADANGWYRCFIQYTAVAGGALNWGAGFSAADGTPNYTGVSTDNISVKEFFLEDVTGQTNQNPSEYVSVGVLSAPYHGAGVDGVKYFNTLNGNTVASNIVTEATGAAIVAGAAGVAATAPVDASGPYGYLSEGAGTSVVLQSNALTTTWAAIGTPAATQNVVGPDGATSAWTLTDNDAGATEGIYQQINVSAVPHALSVYVKKTSGATAYPVIQFTTATGTVRALATIDTNNGVITAWTSYTGAAMAAGISVSIQNVNANYWRAVLVATATAVTWEIDIFPAGTTNATYAGPDLEVAAQGANVFYGVQLEAASFVSTYIPTTTVAVTRNADVLTYPVAGNLSNTVGSVYAEVNPYVAADTQTILSNNNADLTTRWYRGTWRDGTSSISGGSETAGVVSKKAGSYGPTGLVAAMNGSITASNSTATVAFNNGATAISVGFDNSSGGNTNWYNGTIRFLRAYPVAPSSGALTAMTT